MQNKIANALTASHTATGRLDPSEQTFVVQGTQDPDVSCIAHSLGTNQGQENVVYGFLAGASSKSGTTGCQPEQSPTLRAGHGSNSTPAIAFTERTRNGELQIEYQEDVTYALTNPGGGGRANSRCVAYTVHGENSGAMQSGSCPAAFQAAIARCLDATGLDPALNQGSTVVLAPTLSTKNEVANSSSTREEWYTTSALLTNSVRRLTPTECERLQGFPDGWTNIRFKGKPASDSARYKALGNSMAVPVMRWLGERVQLVDDILYAGNRHDSHID
ncbi:MAG: DNA cytosine methyltransferase [Cyanobacteria bacterium J06638_22]